MRGNQKVKAIVDSGALGKIFMVECHWDCAVPQLIGTYREQKVTVGGSFQDHGPHAFDLVRWWTGNDIQEVSATIRSVHPRRPTEDAGVVVLEHENGMFSYHHMTRISYGREQTQDTYRIYGTEGTLVVRNDHHFPTMSLESPEIILYRPGGCVQRFETIHGFNLDDSVVLNFPFYNQLKAFCECIHNHTEPRVTGEDGIHVIEAVVAAYVSSLEGIKVKLPFRAEIDLPELFQSVKSRDKKNLNYNYDIDPTIQSYLQINEHFQSHRPPRTKETWSDEEHGMQGKAELLGLPRRLKMKKD
jgi:predicted dehydrogenase